MRTLNQTSEASGDAIFVTDDTGRVIWASDAAVWLLGTGGEEVVGRKASDFLIPLPAPTAAPIRAEETSEHGWARCRGRHDLLVEACRTSPLLDHGVEVWSVRPATTGSSDRATGPTRDPGGTGGMGSILEAPFELSGDGHFLSVSTAMAELCGYESPQKFLAALSGNPHHFYVEPARHDELMRQLHDTGAVAHFESAIYRRDRTTAWISQSVRPVRDHEGRLRHYAGSVQDIGWRKLAEEILNHADERWRAVVESSGECIVIVDRGGTVFFANGKAQQAGLGRPGENVFNAFRTPDQQLLHTGIEVAFQSMRAEVLNLELHADDAVCVCYEVRVVPIGHVESVERVILVATDLTGKRRAEEAVREGQRLISRVADASPAILYVYDFGSERCVYLNHQMERILGYPTEAFLDGNKSLAGNLVHQDDASLLAERRRLLSTTSDEGVVFEYTVRMQHARGAWRWMRAREVVFTRDADGRPVQIIGMAEDVTERRRAGQERERSREQLRALSARLQEAREEERAAISRRVHDELGQALTALGWELTKLSDQLGSSQKPAGVAERLAGMGAMVDGMMQIVRKVSAELRPPILDHFGLVAAIEWQAQEFQQRYEIQCEVAARTRRTMPDRAVSTAIFRIFQEVLTNVARHSGANKVRVQFNDTPTGFALIVHDNGRGITEAEKSRSLGILGMSERAHLLGGSIKIDGATGRGTTVTVHIPNAAGRPESGPRKETLRSAD